MDMRMLRTFALGKPGTLVSWTMDHTPRTNNGELLALVAPKSLTGQTDKREQRG